MPSEPRNYSQSVENIEDLIAALGNKNEMKRQKTRLNLVEIGTPSVPFLIQVLVHSKARVRWQAAKALGAIKDPTAAPALVNALMDKSFEVRWLAAEGLIALQDDALKSLLKALLKNPEHLDLRQGVHHVLHALEQDGLLNDKCLCLRNKLRSVEAAISVPMAAQTALNSLTQ